MWPDRVSNPGPLTYVSGALPTMLRGLAFQEVIILKHSYKFQFMVSDLQMMVTLKLKFKRLNIVLKNDLK